MKEHTRKLSEEAKHKNEFKHIKKVCTPAADCLFGVNPNCQETLREEFHATAAKPLVFEKEPDQIHNLQCHSHAMTSSPHTMIGRER